jgi:hypothetical protein
MHGSHYIRNYVIRDMSFCASPNGQILRVILSLRRVMARLLRVRKHARLIRRGTRP